MLHLMSFLFLSVSWILVNALSYFSCIILLMFSHVFMYVLIVKILSYMKEIKNIHRSRYGNFMNVKL